jgi:putative endonuclease
MSDMEGCGVDESGKFPPSRAGGGADAKSRGDWGETLALTFLTQKGYRCVAKGYRSRYGEIDLIVRDGEYIAFVEVKLRKDDVFAQAREFVSRTKQRKIKATAMLWLSSHETRLQPRFDVVEVYARPGGAESPRIIHLEDAFR